MNIFTNRPLFISCILFLICSVAGYFISGYVKIIIFVLSLAALVSAIILAALKARSYEMKNAFVYIILCLMMTALAFLSSYIFFNIKSIPENVNFGEDNYIEASVNSIEYENEYSSRYEITVSGANDKPSSHKAYIDFDYPAALKPGDNIVAYAVAAHPSNNSGIYNDKEEAISNGIFVIYHVDSVNDMSLINLSDEKGIMHWFDKIKFDMSLILTSNIGGEAGRLSSALLLGNKNMLSNATLQGFRRVGASHILALSGMHISIIMGALMFLLKKIIYKRSIILIILSVIAIFYLALTGFSVSACRSVIMLLLVYAAFLISGIPDSLTSLSLAGFIIVLCSPGTIMDASFWMSFSSTFGIISFTPAANDFFGEILSNYKHKSAPWVIRRIIFVFLSAIITSIAAIIPLIIVMCIFIKQISFLSLLSSLVLSIPTAIIIVLSLFLLPLHNVPFLSNVIVFIIQKVSDFMIRYCAELSDSENIICSLNYPFALLMAIILGIALLYSLTVKHKLPYLSLIPFVVCLCIFIGTIHIYDSVNSENVKIAYINASTRSDMIVISNNGESVICDISNGSYTSYRYALNEMDESRSTEIKAILLTRYTTQHNSTLSRLFSSCKVRAIWVPYPSSNDEVDMLENLFDISKSNDVDVYVYNEGEVLTAFENTYIEHLNDYISRSTVPIDLISIYTDSDRVTYSSPAFNESNIEQKAQSFFSDSEYIIFGCRGPKVKKEFSVNRLMFVKAVIFSDEALVSNYAPAKNSIHARYFVPKQEKIILYLDK